MLSKRADSQLGSELLELEELLALLELEGLALRSAEADFWRLLVGGGSALARGATSGERVADWLRRREPEVGANDTGEGDAGNPLPPAGRGGCWQSITWRRPEPLC